MKNQTSMKMELCHDAIAQKAYELWQAAGCPMGCDMEHWLQAEAELRAAGRRNAPMVVVSLNANPKPGPVRSVTPVKTEPQSAGNGRKSSSKVIEGLRRMRSSKVMQP